MSVDLTKVDAKLGVEVHNYLTQKGVETPRVIVETPFNEDTDQLKIDKVQAAFTTIMETMGMDLADDSLRKTPERVAKMFIKEMFWGLDPNYFPKMTAVANKMGYDEMVIERNIVVQSTCEHHFVMIDGYAHIAYIPRNHVLGLSKLNRIVKYFARRPQIQERLTEQIYYTLEYILQTPDIAVMINAQHYCVKSRGVQDINSDTITSKLGGCFKEEPATRQEFLSLVRNPSKNA